MLPRRERLKRSHLFTRAYNTKKVVATTYFTLYVLPRIAGVVSVKRTNNLKNAKIKSVSEMNLLPLVGFVVSKKVSKSACLRNRMKRRVREAYRLSKMQGLNQWYVMILVIKESVLDASWPDICRTMKSAFGEAQSRYGC